MECPVAIKNFEEELEEKKRIDNIKILDEIEQELIDLKKEIHTPYWKERLQNEDQLKEEKYSKKKDSIIKKD